MDALAELLPRVAERLPRVRLGDWPTPIEPLAVGADTWVKREDLSAATYGGNKVRCLEPVFGALREQGVRRAWATGAWGSNQALAIAVHAATAGLEAGALLFPQPRSAAAAANLSSLAAQPIALRLTRSVLTFPFAWARLRLAGEVIIPPGAATPRGALGHLAAALEVAVAVQSGALPAPAHVVVPVGSTCTTAGLMVGFAAAGVTTHVHAIRVSPWPVTAAFRINALADRTAALLRALGGPAVEPTRLTVHRGYLGRGYGRATAAGRAAIEVFAGLGAPKLDTTYSAKAGAALLDLRPALDGPTLFWSTKSAALPPATEAGLARLPARAQRWIALSDPRSG